MRRLLGPVLVGVVVALAGCHGVKVDLGASPTASSHSGKSSDKSKNSQSASTAIQAAGPVSAGSGALRVLSEPQAGLSAIYKLINGAKSSIDLTMYTLRDTTAEEREETRWRAAAVFRPLERGTGGPAGRSS